MDKLQKNSLTIIVSVVISVVLVWGFGLGGKSIQTVTKEVVKEAGQTLGALSSPDIPSSYLRWGGVATYRMSEALNTATNTPCALVSPPATSTLRTTVLNISTPTSTAIALYASVGTSAYATTTQLGKWTVASGKLGTAVFNATTTTTIDDTGTVFPPNTNLVWTVAGTAISGTANLNGSCHATWDSI